MTLDTKSATCDPLKWLEEHGDALYGYCMLRVRDPGVAEDLVQEALLAALQAVDSFRGQSSERTWLVGILKNKVCDHLRKIGRERPMDNQVLVDEATDEYFDETRHWANGIAEWNNPQQSLEREEFWVTMNDCIGRLPERLRVLYTLREIDQLETKELIKILNISSENNLWVMMSRARTHLRQCLEINWFTL